MPTPKEKPTELADEIRRKSGSWSLSSARFQPADARGTPSFRVAVALTGGAVWSEIALDGARGEAAQQAVRALRRSGYEILGVASRPFRARRPLRGVRELGAEVRRLEAASRSASTFHTFPARLPRRRGLPDGAGPVSGAAFDRLRDEHRWTLVWVSAARTGRATLVHAADWSVGAWCSAYDDDEDRWLALHVQLFQRPSAEATTTRDFARLARSFRAKLEPLGYVAPKLRETGGRRFVALDMGVRTLAEARLARRRLDELLFGD